MSLKIWLDGQLVEKENAKLSVFDHGALYGDGVFEGIRAYNGRIFECEAHVRRFWDSAKAIRLQIPCTPGQFTAAMNETVKANNLLDCYIRAVCTRGPGDLGIDPRKSPRPILYIIADQVAVFPKEVYEKGIAVISSSWKRNHSSSLPPRIKSLNYLNNILAKLEANDAGANDALMLNHAGNVAELTAANVFIVRDGKLVTPALTDGILEGVTRRVVMGLATKLGYTVTERSIDRFDVYAADEMFATGTGAEVIAITRVDGRVIGSGAAGPVTTKLLETFRRHVRE